MAGYLPLFILLLLAVVIAVAMFTLTSLIGPKNPTPEKMMPYESGSDSDGAQHVKPSVKFYLTAILFVVFDLEVVFLYPWAIQYRKLGWDGLIIMAPFFLLLVVGLIFEWKKGALEWEK